MLENSWISKPLNEFINTLGNIKIGITIPPISPYFARAVSQLRPDFSSLNGIINCLKVESPERIYEVIAIGTQIFNISFVCYNC